MSRVAHLNCHQAAINKQCSFNRSHLGVLMRSLRQQRKQHFAGWLCQSLQLLSGTKPKLKKRIEIRRAHLLLQFVREIFEFLLLSGTPLLSLRAGRRQRCLSENSCRNWRTARHSRPSFAASSAAPASFDLRLNPSRRKQPSVRSTHPPSALKRSIFITEMDGKLKFVNYLL